MKLGSRVARFDPEGGGCRDQDSLLALALAIPLGASGAALAQPAAQAALPPLAQRIVHTDPTAYRHSPAVHGGAGEMDFGTLLGAQALDTNSIFLHRGVIQPKSGIGAHFHNQCEEMFVILDGEAQFTVDGRTSLLKGRPARRPAWATRTGSTTPPTSRCSG